MEKALERGRSACGESACGCRVSGKPHETRIAERQSTSVSGVLGESREVHVYEAHVLERREARARSGRAVVDALQGSRNSFLFLLFGLCVNDCGKAPVGDT